MSWRAVRSNCGGIVSDSLEKPTKPGADTGPKGVPLFYIFAFTNAFGERCHACTFAPSEDAARAATPPAFCDYEGAQDSPMPKWAADQFRA